MHIPALSWAGIFFALVQQIPSLHYEDVSCITTVTPRTDAAITCITRILRITTNVPRTDATIIPALTPPKTKTAP